VALVWADKAQEVAAAVAREYEVETGLEPEIYITSATAGTAVV
jgi:galactokinase